MPLPNASPNFLRDKMSIEIVGCDNDYYRNAMVAGWLVNLDDATAYNIPLVAEIQSSGGIPVEDGVREFTVSNVPPMSKTKFSVVFEKTSTWKKCRVYIK